MLRWILALLLIPFLDAVLLAVVVSQTGVIGWTGMVLLVVLTGLIGMLLVRAEGRRTIGKIQRQLAAGSPPTDALLDGALLIAAGAFLLTPGLVTDLIGFLLVLPPTRIPIRAGIKRFVIVPYADKKTDGFTSGAVWTVGFPGGNDEPQSAWSDSSAAGQTEAYDLDEESYSVEFGDDASTRETEDDPSTR
ncbi:membrane protein FxsA [Halobacteria archaeon AArc-dxtr1]|nr:membrane protein FxsA [Halobacteria archaeon AArc-dxtr1]